MYCFTTPSPTLCYCWAINGKYAVSPNSGKLKFTSVNFLCVRDWEGAQGPGEELMRDVIILAAATHGLN